MPFPAHIRPLLALSFLPGLGHVLHKRLLPHFGSMPEAPNPAAIDKLWSASQSGLQAMPGIGPERAKVFFTHREQAFAFADEQLATASKHGISYVTQVDRSYPPLLHNIPDPPLLLSMLGSINAHSDDAYCIALVGSRACTQYGREQTARFTSLLASSGLTVVSGGARGIDTVAHQTALQAGGRTIVVLGCGLLVTYPPENKQLFAEIAESGRGCIISELPLNTPPSADNFPPRNRIISGLSLGVLVIEAAKGSGSLITAKQAIEEHNREVFAVPGRVDSPASAGANELIKMGGAQLVTAPGDVLEALQTPARHAHQGTHAARYTPMLFDEAPRDAQRAPAPSPPPTSSTSHGDHSQVPETSLARSGSTAPTTPARSQAIDLSPSQHAILKALANGPLTLDALLAATALAPHTLQADLTILELRRQVKRTGSQIERVSRVHA